MDCAFSELREEKEGCGHPRAGSLQAGGSREAGRPAAPAALSLAAPQIAPFPN